MALKPRKRNDKTIKLVGENIRKIRQSKGLTMIQLSYMMDVDYSQIANLELGRRDPTLSMLVLVAERLNVTVGELLSENK